MKWSICLVFLVFSLGVQGQEYSWWNEKHDWDGHTHWSDYIIISPGFLGPNALPVPEETDGLVKPDSHLEIAYDQHISNGDRTKNLYSEIHLSLFDGRLGFDISMVPVEFYDMDTVTRDLRRARDRDGEGSSLGDVYIGTNIQLLREKAVWPDVLLSVNIKTASGSKLSAARHADAPAYYFDFSVGKTFDLDHLWFQSLRPYGLLGFYAWQVNRTDYFQNDAILYGLGLKARFPFLVLNQYFGGYSGYIGNGDRPMVYRAELYTQRDASINYTFRYQEGLRDYEYTSLRFGIALNLDFLFGEGDKSK